MILLQDNITHIEFENKCWNYYLLLEQNFINLTNYIMLDKSNFNTYSFNIMNQILCVCIEIESVIKIITKKDSILMKEQIKYLCTILPEISNEKVTVIGHPDISIHPFKELETIKSDIQNSSISWWFDYGKIKHNRLKNINSATFYNLLKSLSALFVLDIYCLKNSAINDEKDSPNIDSKLFTPSNLKFKCINFGNGNYLKTETTE